MRKAPSDVALVRGVRGLSGPMDRHPSTVRRRARRRLLTAQDSVFVIASALCTTLAAAQSEFAPTAVFVQAGTGGDTHQAAAGLNWDWRRHWSLGRGQVGGFWEVSLSGWSYPAMDGRRKAWLGQLGVVPTFRYRPADGASPWFAEVGIGATLMTTVYETERKRFSTSFNFADHIGVGRNFGAAGEHEVSLRLEHFSNAGIKHPNPGENFAEVRYTYRFP